MGVDSLNVLGDLAEVEALDHGEGVGQARLVLPLEAALEAPEHVGHQRHIARLGQAVGQAPHVVINTEDLLEDEHARPGAAGRQSAVGVEHVAVEAGHLLIPSAVVHEARNYRASMGLVS
jgi:hypothetical protein